MILCCIGSSPFLRRFFPIVFFMVLVLSGLGADIYYQGTVDSVYAFRTESSNELRAARSMFRGEVEGYSGDVGFKASATVEYNTLVESKSGIELGEAYLEYLGLSYDVRLGRQIIVWGCADGVQITDIVSPKDNTAYVGLEYEDTRLPVEALRFRLNGNYVTLDTIWVPLHSPSRIASDPDNPLYSSYSGLMAVSEGDDSVRFQDSEWGMRLSAYFSRLDVSAAFYSCLDDLPVFQSLVDDDGNTSYEMSYKRIWMAGTDASLPAGSLVFRFEGACIGDRYFQTDSLLSAPKKADQCLALAGADWNPGAGWTFGLQYGENFLVSSPGGIGRDWRKQYGTFNVSKSLLRETLSLDSSGYVGLNYGDAQISVSAEYALSDELELSLGTILFRDGEDGKGDYSGYTDLSCVWMRGRYVF